MPVPPTGYPDNPPSQQEREESDDLVGEKYYGAVEVNDEPETETESDWGQIEKDVPSFIVVACVIFLGDAYRGINFPTLWPLVESLGGDRVMQGYVVACFSFGRCFASPLIGKLNTIYGFRATLIGCNLMILIGTIIYSHARSLAWLFAAQICVGIGSGSLGVTRAYAAELSTPKSRTGLLGFMSAIQYAGFTCTPFLGSLLASLFRHSTIMFGVKVDQFSAPAYCTGIMSILCILFLTVIFREPAHSVERIMNAAQPENRGESTPLVQESSQEVALEGGETRVIDETRWCSSATPVLIALILLNFGTRGAIGCFETTGTIVSLQVYHEDVVFTGHLFGICGSCGVIVLIYLGSIVNLFSEMYSLIFGILMMLASSIILVVFTYQGASVHWFEGSVWLMYALGFPIGNTVVLGLYSKVAQGMSQSELLSWFGTAGSAARVLFPIFSGILTERYGVSVLFECLSGFLVVTLLFVFVMYDRILYFLHHKANVATVPPITLRPDPNVSIELDEATASCSIHRDKVERLEPYDRR